MIKTITTGPSVELGTAGTSRSMIEGGCAGSARSMIQWRAVYCALSHAGRSVHHIGGPAHVAILPAVRNSTIVGAESVIYRPIGCGAARNPAVIGAHPVVAYTIGRSAVCDSTVVGTESVISRPVGSCAPCYSAIVGAHPMAAHLVALPATRDSTIIGAHPVVAYTVGRRPMRACRCHVARVRRIDVVATVIHGMRTTSGTATGLWRRLWRRILFLILGSACHNAKPQNRAKHRYSRETLHGIAKKLHFHSILVPCGGLHSTPVARPLYSTPPTLLLVKVVFMSCHRRSASRRAWPFSTGARGPRSPDRSFGSRQLQLSLTRNAAAVEPLPTSTSKCLGDRLRKP